MDGFALCIGTIWLRPYVFAFLLGFGALALAQVGARRALVWLAAGFLIAFACEWSSTRSGFPFGLYVYDEATRGRELWLSNVPAFDSLSFSFLSFVSWSTARRLLGQGVPRGKVEPGLAALALGAALMTGIDLVSDPIALHGERWFLGHLFDYAEPGPYFGVPLTNFAGWCLVGAAIIGLMMALERGAWLGPAAQRRSPGGAAAAPAFYVAIVLFNVAIAFWIGLPGPGAIGLGLCAAVLAPLGLRAAVARQQDAGGAAPARSA